MKKIASILFSILTVCTISLEVSAQNTGYFGKKNLIGIETLSCMNNDFLDREDNIFTYNKNTSKLLLKYGIIYERILNYKTNVFISTLYGKGKSEFKAYDTFYLNNYSITSNLICSYIIYNQIGATLGFKFYKKGNYNPIGRYFKISGGILQNTIKINPEDYLKINISETNINIKEFYQEYKNYLGSMQLKSLVFQGTLGLGNQFMLNDFLALDVCINLNAGLNYNNAFITPKYKYEIEETIDISGTKKILIQNMLLFAVALKFVG